MNNVTFIDTSAAAKAQFNKNIGKCLNVLGMEFVRISGEEADRLIYDTPFPKSAFRADGTRRKDARTGDYGRNLMYQVNIGDRVVYCGVSQEIPYALFLEAGTWKMAARPVISNTIQNNQNVWREIIRDILGEGFGTTGGSTIGTLGSVTKTIEAWRESGFS